MSQHLGAVALFVRDYDEATERRADGKLCSALVSSGYVRRGQDWKMAFHQQTPLASK